MATLVAPKLKYLDVMCVCFQLEGKDCNLSATTTTRKFRLQINNFSNILKKKEL